MFTHHHPLGHTVRVPYRYISNKYILLHCTCNTNLTYLISKCIRNTERALPPLTVKWLYHIPNITCRYTASSPEVTRCKHQDDSGIL